MGRASRASCHSARNVCAFLASQKYEASFVRVTRGELLADLPDHDVLGHLQYDDRTSIPCCRLIRTVISGIGARNIGAMGVFLVELQDSPRN